VGQTSVIFKGTNAQKSGRVTSSLEGSESFAFTLPFTGGFDEYERKTTSISEKKVVAAIPIIAGEPADVESEQDVYFTNLEIIIEGRRIVLQPDLFDGAHLLSLHGKMSDDLDGLIVPSRHAIVPITPNFFLEAKGSKYSTEVASAQATLDGTYGARTMYSLQNYLVDKPQCDGNVYAFSAVVTNGLLELYAHHVTYRENEGDGQSQSERELSYHTTVIMAFALTYGEAFSDGRTALRNLRAKAKQYRDHFIKIANDRGRQVATLATVEKGPPRITERCTSVSSNSFDPMIV
jgi:hypothetical protein